MALAGTPNAGLDEIGRSAYVFHGPYSLVCYCNTRNSLDADTLTAELIQPNVFNGYAPILLNQLWQSVNGDVTYPVKPRWTASGSWNLPVRGVAMVFNAIVLHFQDLSTPDFVPVNGAWLEVDLLNVL